MALDAEGGRAVNLLAGDTRNDIYQMVADEMTRLVIEDAKIGQGNPELIGKISRSMVKRGVMTTPYGVTSLGLLKQLKKDRVLDHIGNPYLIGPYFRDKLAEAIKLVSGKANELMGWFKKAAEIMAESGRPIDWTSPSGMRVRQGYRKLGEIRVDTEVVKGMRIRPLIWKQLPGYNKTKQKNSIAPNLIHSFDAAHLQIATVRQAEVLKEWGFLAYPVTVHDSYGTLPPFADRLLTTLKETFVEIYSENWLDKLHQDWSEQALGIPAPPKRGDLDITNVLKSAFIFS
jgi:DNA-directed RNA polymerase